MSEYSDKELLDLFHQQDQSHYAFNLIVRKYQQKLYYVIRRLVIDHDHTHDVLQNTFIKAWKGLSNFREASGLYTWLYRIACNESLSFITKNKKHLHQKLEDHYQNPELSSSGSDLDETTIQKKLQEAILSLPEKQRLVFTLRYYDEMPYEEMSKILDTSVGALKASYFHASTKIEEFLMRELNHIKIK